MPQLIVDKNSCNHCALCEKRCPMAIIETGTGIPSYIPGREDRCMICGHCQAVCPSGAISVEDQRLDQATYQAHGDLIPLDRLGLHLRSRRSIRDYKQKPVPREILEGLLDVVRYAPSGINSQEVGWIVIHDTQELRRITGLAIDWMRHMNETKSPMNSHFDFPAMITGWENGHDPVCRLAPHLIIAHTPRTSLSGRIDAIIALANLDIAAPSAGVGTCWAGMFHIAAMSWKPLMEALALPKGHDMVYAMMIGYPETPFQRIPKRNKLHVSWR